MEIPKSFIFQAVPITGLKSGKRKRALGITKDMEPYDILKDLDKLQPSISMKQLLAIAPECRTTLNTSLIRRRSKVKEVHEVSLNPDPGAPTIDVTIDGVMVTGVQVDGGSSVNLMNSETMHGLDMKNLVPTSLILRMADQSRVKPMGILRSVITTIAGIQYPIDYIVFKLNNSSLSYPILLGRPWLYQAKAKNDWGRGTLTIGKGKNKTSLQMYPVVYHGETQLEENEVTSDQEYDSDTDSGDEIPNPTQVFPKHLPVRHVQFSEMGRPYKGLGPGEYLITQEDVTDSDHALAKWMNNVYSVTQESELETTSDPLEEDGQVTDTLQLPEHVNKDTCQNLNLGDDEHTQNIRLYKGLPKLELKYSHTSDFFIRNKKVFAWTYKDLRGIPPDVCEHKIILEDNAAPIRQRQHRLNPKYSLMVKEELNKLLEAGFIYPIPHSEWVSPIVMVPKKNGKIRICQDFRKLNAVTKKDYFPLPFTDSILDAVTGHECYSFLDGFSGYNQVQIAMEDRIKTTFTTDWGTYAYTVMPFGLCNAPATFQRAMTVAFQDYLRHFMEIFLDDFCVFSTKETHAECLSKCFAQCKKYGISLNAAKCQFLVPCGKLLGHIVSIHGIMVDPAKVAVIINLPLPDSVTEVRAFLGHVGYYRRYIFAYAILALPLTQLLKKTTEEGIKPIWTKECSIAFQEIKQRLITAPVLISPNWDKEFQVYVDASNVAIGSVLSQKDDRNFDHPIYFASRQLIAAERNYTTTEREALGMIYSVQKISPLPFGIPICFPCRS